MLADRLTTSEREQLLNEKPMVNFQSCLLYTSQQQMINVSPLHNRELELLLTSLIAELPEQPVKELKKLLEIYSELLSVNNSRVTDERILQLLEIWKNTANLKKVIVSINR